jgi:hypothetical protein
VIKKIGVRVTYEARLTRMSRPDFISGPSVASRTPRIDWCVFPGFVPTESETHPGLYAIVRSADYLLHGR